MGKYIQTNQSEFISEKLNGEQSVSTISYEVKDMVLEIPKQRKESFDKLLKKAARICKFLNIPTPKVKSDVEKAYFVIRYQNPENREVVTLTDTISDDIKKVKAEFESKKYSNSDRFFIQKGLVNVVDLEIVTDIKPDNEWVILGVIDHKNEILRAAPNQQIPFDKIPSDLSNCSCDHCKKERVRNKTVFIQNIESGEIMRVGGSCIKYYLGANFEKVLEFLGDLNNLMEFPKSSEISFIYGYSPQLDDYFDVKEIVKFFFYYVRKYGYVSSNSAESANTKNLGTDKQEVQSSKDIVTEVVCKYIVAPSKPKPYEREEFLKKYAEFEKIVKAEKDDKYNDFIAFVENGYKENNFLFNVRNFIKKGAVNVDYIRYIISACSMYEGKLRYEEYKKKSQEERDKEKAELIKTSNWVGEVGQKEPLKNLEILSIRSFSTDFGMSSVYKLRDEKGNIFTKFGTINKKFVVNNTPDVVVGSIISATAEIKNHDTYQDVKQTVLGRLSKI